MLHTNNISNGTIAKRKMIDSHVHYWNPDRVQIPWIYKAGGKFAQARLVPEYMEQIPDDIEVEGVIFVEADVEPTQGLVEAKWIHEYAKQVETIAGFGGISGLVVYAPVNQGKHVVNYLDLLKSIVEDFQHVKGIRFLLEDPSRDPTIPASETFIEGVQALADYGLSFDININCHDCPEQFPPVVELVKRCPNVQFILDHMAKPPISATPSDKRFEFWKTHLQAIAQYPNVVCKVSGAITEVDEPHGLPTVGQVKQVLDVVVEAFGHDRIMAGGDWPVVERKGSELKSWFLLLEDITSQWSQADQEKLWAKNAKKVYRI
jgi:L-fuconolactonase